MSELAGTEKCLHRITVKDLCVQCGEDLRKIHNDFALNIGCNHSVVLGRNMQLQLNSEMLKKQIQTNTEKLLREKKLSLILDIDHTLIHAVPDDGSMEIIKSAKFGLDPLIADEIYCFTFSTGRDIILKLRPGIKNFLNAVSEFFDVRVYTMGVRPYAEKVINLIDPMHKVIGRRFACRDDFTDDRKLYKNHNRLFPVDKKMVLVVDDRIDVWKKISNNVIKVPKFYFFPENRNGLGVNYLTKKRDFELKNKDNVLETVKNMLLAFHKTFYNRIDNNLNTENLKHHMNTARILKKTKKGVLKGTVLVFSGIFSSKTAVEKTFEYKLALEFGAKCVLDFNEENSNKVTHILGLHKQTKETKLAAKMDGIDLVTVYWLYHSANHFVKAEEKDFKLDFSGKDLKTPVICWNDKVQGFGDYLRPLLRWKDKREVKKRKFKEVFTIDDIDKEFKSLIC